MRELWNFLEGVFVATACGVAMALWTAPVENLQAQSVPARTSQATDGQQAEPKAAQPPPSRSEAPRAPDPQSIDELKQLQGRIQECVRKVQAATVCVQIGNGQGSGVIVNKEGLVLTAAHVSGDPGQPARIILADGRRLKAETLGANRPLDASMVQITTPGEWDFVELGDSDSVLIGNWCVAIGHPGGYMRQRPPVVRVGRVVMRRRSVIQTDCLLVGGDSGGPLFDLDGRVIGIHSRIGAASDWNFHVPAQVYQENWKRLVAAETWGQRPGRKPGARAQLGIVGETVKSGCRVVDIVPGTAAETAGLKPGDIITRFDDQPVAGIDELIKLVDASSPEDRVELLYLRGDKSDKLEVQLKSRPR